MDFAAAEKLQGIYNLVIKDPQSSRDLLDRLSEQHDLPKVMWNPSERQVRPYNTRVSNQKIEAAGYKFIHPEILIWYQVGAGLMKIVVINQYLT